MITDKINTTQGRFGVSWRWRWTKDHPTDLLFYPVYFCRKYFVYFYIQKAQTQKGGFNAQKECIRLCSKYSERQEMPLVVDLWCLELCLYGIIELASALCAEGGGGGGGV